MRTKAWVLLLAANPTAFDYRPGNAFPVVFILLLTGAQAKSPFVLKR